MQPRLRIEPQLKDLEKQRRSAIKAEIADLENRISEDGQNLISAYVQDEIAKKSTTVSLIQKGRSPGSAGVAVEL